MAEAPNKKRMIANARLRKSRERTSRLIKLFLFFKVEMFGHVRKIVRSSGGF